MAETDNVEPQMIEFEGAPTMRRSEQYVSIYSNQIEIGFSPWDIQFSFMQVHGRTTDVVGEELASVTMSPQHAKALIFPFLRTIIQYEEQHGIIQLPNNQPREPLFDMLRKLIEQAVAKAEAAKAEATKNQAE